MPCRLPAPVLSGFLGSGRTTLLQHVLADGGGRKVVVIADGRSSR